MSTYTPNLNLLKKNPLTEGSDVFNIETMMNDNWDKIDSFSALLEASIAPLYSTSRRPEAMTKRRMTSTANGITTT